MRVVVARVPRPNVEQAIEVSGEATVFDVLRAIGAPPDAVVVLRGDAPIPVDGRLAEGDRLRVINVFSGG